MEEFVRENQAEDERCLATVEEQIENQSKIGKHNSKFLTNLNFPPKQKSPFSKKPLVVLTSSSRLRPITYFDQIFAEIWSK